MQGRPVKESFARRWVARERQRQLEREELGARMRRPRITMPGLLPFGQRQPPGLVGGDYDRLPAVGGGGLGAAGLMPGFRPSNGHPLFPRSRRGMFGQGW